MRILITGGTGFQGSHLVRFWAAAGHEITVLNTYGISSEAVAAKFPSTVNIVWGSITDSEIVGKTVRGQDVVVHMAARINVDESRSEPLAYISTNVIGTYNILEALKGTGGRMIYASSCEVYGTARQGKATESSELLPHSPYAASKAAADRFCFAFHKTYGTDVTVVRPCNIYGPGQKSGYGGAVIPIFVEKALANEPLTLFGDGSQSREYMNIGDLISAYDLVLRNRDLAGKVINFGTGESVTVRTIAELISTRFESIIQTGPVRPGEVRSIEMDCSVATGLGFAPMTRFVDGLNEYIEWRLSQ